VTTSPTTYVPPTEEKDLRKIILAIQQLAAGRSNATGVVTLAPGTTTTTVSPSDPVNTGARTVAPQSAVFLFPKTAHAAAELAAGGCYVSIVGKQKFTVTHANNAQSDRMFFYLAVG
jgi:hypothetical protein